jgi:hypothetical protein
MPAGLAQIFEARRTEVQRRGWPAPTHKTTQREQKAWLEYWSSLERRAEREGWGTTHLRVA